MSSDIPTQYAPSAVEGEIYQRWLQSGVFAAVPDERAGRYVVMMPLPNVTGALHMGHAMDNVMQDMLVRWHRMQGDNTLWQPGTDHAGIATQAVVEKRLFELEGKTRHDLGREALVRRIWEWKDQYQTRIVQQQQSMGCSCDWERQRFTMDAVCTRAVREAFFRLFRDGLVCRGNRLVNWDCLLQTAVSDDEVVRETRQGGFWHLRYPVIDPEVDEPAYVVVATTRPETMLGDTAVAVHPAPGAALEQAAAKLAERITQAPAKDRPALEQELDQIKERAASLLPRLEQLARMARAGRKVLLPLMEREIPLILDEWARPELGSGCVKITPAHDPNDYDVWTRHRERIDIINILNPDGTLNEHAGAYRGQDRFEARKKVVADLERRGLLEAFEEREYELGVSDRSKTVIEPFLSRQWFIRMGDVPGGVVFGRGTEHEFRGPGLAQAAIDAASGSWRSPTGRMLEFHPDPERYRATYADWLTEKRDWCISRQLWWGHRIPIWSAAGGEETLARAAAALAEICPEDACCRAADAEGGQMTLAEARAALAAAPARGPFEVQVCLRDEAAEDRHAAALEAAGLARDEGVLDTWFSSALWPFSTLGWPDPESAPVGPGQRPLGGGVQSSLRCYYPGSCLVTGRDIITLWVARMAILGLYCLGDLPFTDTFIHANILDGKGERMSKSKGNGIDPVDIIKRYGADAMRYVLCDMQTGTQDIRLPVQAISPFTGKPVELAKAKHGRTVFTSLCPETSQEFDVLGTLPDVPQAELISDRFEVGRNFCNKLWNAARFALLNLEGQGFRPLGRGDLLPEDRWILSRLAHATAAVTRQLEKYCPSAALAEAREFFWNELCDWYLEIIKPRLRGAGGREVAGQVLAFVVDQALRLLHPFVPFISEALWERLNGLAPRRGLEAELACGGLLAVAAWPAARGSDRDRELEQDFAQLQDAVRAIRNLRARHGVSPQRELEAWVKAGGRTRTFLDDLRERIMHLARLSRLEVAEEPEKPALAATSVSGEVEVYVAGLVDPEQERQRLEKQRANLEKQARGLEVKLANESFLARAPAHIVEAERRRLQELSAELQKVVESLSRL